MRTITGPAGLRGRLSGHLGRGPEGWPDEHKPTPGRGVRVGARRLRLAAVGLVIAALAVLLAAVTGGGVATHNPLAGDQFFVDPQSPAALAANSATTPTQARELRAIAGVPVARWFGDWIAPLEVTGAVERFVVPAASAGRVPVLVLYDIPDRDCGGAAQGGATTAAAYRDFARSFARGLGHGPAVVIVEPDALAQLTCLSAPGQNERLGLIRYVVRLLHRRTHVSTYLDAGNSGFAPAATIGRRLREADVSDTAGFALNVSNFFTTASQTAYGHRVSAAADGAHFVIDTSRNGRGPTTGPSAWCNPAGRAIGHVPTTDTGDPLVDAWLWVKTPGVSDGACGVGQPPAGQFWLAYALGLERRAA